MSEYLREPEDRYDRDDYGAVINGEDTYKELSKALWGEQHSVVFPWADEYGQQYDILMVFGPEQAGELGRGMNAGTDLFVAVSGCGMFGFDMTNQQQKYPSYVSEKLNVHGESAVKLSHLINGVIWEMLK